ncbi:LOW QUALITY PROTEIN: uncharacterized protein [Amphiura filiformis]|uniref:LOW QUALITY PROTEIN: uncharacterized protein n=1 Tax=Amphiura filiformis TaxID=82378 RepID=UPI003B21620A
MRNSNCGEVTYDTMMLETDIILRGIGTENQTNIPVHAHPPDTDSDITLVEWLDRITQEPNKGMKLDFKYIEAVEPSMVIIKEKESQIHVPLWVNADIVKGPNSPKDPIPPRVFIDSCNKYFPLTTMSLGFTTYWNATATEDLYTWQMIFDNIQYTYPLKQPVTFPIRAIWCLRSWDKFTWLMGLKDDFSITVWSGANDVVDVTGLINLRYYGDSKRIYYDLPDPLMAEFKQALEDGIVQPPPRMQMWNVDLWEPILSRFEGDFVFLSTEGVGIMGGQSAMNYAGCVQSIDQMKPSQKMIITGTVQFVNKYETNSGETTLEIAFRTTGLWSSSGSGVTDGILASISNNGKITLYDMNSEKEATLSLPEAECYQFEVTDDVENATCRIKVEIVRCSDAKSAPPNEGEMLDVSLKDVPDLDQYEKFHVAFGKLGNSKDIVVEDFYVEGGAGLARWSYVLLFVLAVLSRVFI